MTTGPLLSSKLLVLALTATLALSGCIASLKEELESNTADAGAMGTVEVLLTATNVGDLSHLGVQVDRVFVHEAGAPPLEGFFNVTVAADHVDLVADGQLGGQALARADVPAGTYDQVVLRLDGVDIAMAAEADDGHAHDDDASEGHDHGSSDVKTVAQGVDVPINVTFEVPEGKTTSVTLEFDAGASTEGGDFTPRIVRAIVKVDGDTVDQIDDPSVEIGGTVPGVEPATKPPVARVAIFAPDGAAVYTADFLAEDGDFANSQSSAFGLGDEIRFSGTDSEAVQGGATISSYAWDFDDGTTADGPNVAHAYDQPGVFEVELTVRDSMGVDDTQVVRVVVLAKEWTATLAETGFEDGAGDWTVETNGGALAPAVETTWALSGPGRDSATSWHVGHQLPVLTSPVGIGYTASVSTTLTSPTFTIPSDWSSAGFHLYIAGASEDGFDILSVSMVVGGESRSLGDFSGGGIGSGMGDWIDLGADDALADATGEDVQFVFTFTSDDIQEVGPGWYVDDLTIGGVDLPLHKAELLDEGAHDGHDHEH